MKVFSDRYFHLGILKAIEQHTKIAPTYSYHYKLNSKIGIAGQFQMDPSVYGATHVDDLAVIFNSSAFFEPIDRLANANLVSEFMTNVLVNFAKFG